jgi:hypothetical protein
LESNALQPRPTEITQDEMLAALGFMAGFPRRWWIAGGWALDLWVADTPSRIHEDLEFGILRADQDALREHFATGWHVFKSITGRDGTGAWAPWLRGEWLDQPSFQVLAQRSHAHAEAKAGLPSEIEFFLNDTVGEEWVFRRDTSVRVALQRLTVAASVGVQVLAPEVQLLHKAKSHRPRDEHDFARVLPHLDRARLVWLHSQLSRHLPNDPWLVSLEASLMSRH